MPVPLETIEREVWATPAEFRHGLDLAFPGGATESDGILRVTDGDAEMDITLEVMSPRAIAQLIMPRMKVSLRMTAGSAPQRAAMLMRMDRAMQRGGG